MQEANGDLMYEQVRDIWYVKLPIRSLLEALKFSEGLTKIEVILVSNDFKMHANYAT